MSINLTDKEYLLLSQFAYLKFDNYESVFLDWKQSNFTLADIISDINNTHPKIDFYQNGSVGNNDFYGNENHIVDADSILGQIANDPVLSALTLKDFVNHNSTDGLVAYCFENATGDTVFSFTGTEEEISITAMDWADNIFGLGIAHWSAQFSDALNFVNANKVNNCDIYVTGHSKGGANAMYIAANIDGVQGEVFDAPGIGQCLNVSQLYCWRKISQH